ncbi:MAG TPA: undecaprenyl-diphosphatase UppP [Polyangia bacterium]|nr:undecaprenyl-diphosphatase UppP [Polyangia bacterium]
MTTFEALVLGVVQGVTEFLPISSTAHLRIVPALAGWPDAGAAFTAVLQLGTLAAVVGYFLPELLRMVRAAIAALKDRSHPPEPAARQLGYIVVGSIPIGVFGLVFKHAIEGSLRSLWVISTTLIVVAIALAWVERRARHRRDMDDIRLRDALIIGFAQALALIPGVSRSGITLVAALAIGLRRDAAARFSFLLGVPAIAAAGVFEIKPLLHARDVGGTAMAVGLLAAAGTGYISIAWLLRYLRARTTMPFVVYRIALGALLLALLFTGRLAP